MPVALGPVLSFKGLSPENSWGVSVLVVTDIGQAPQISVEPASVQVLIGQWQLLAAQAASQDATKRHHIWHCDLDVVQQAGAIEVTYRIDGAAPATFAVPPLGAVPGIIYASCNGFSDPKYMKAVDDNMALWKRAKGLHTKTPHHLLIMGGDQVYADEIWSAFDELEAWLERPWATANQEEVDAQLATRIDTFYLELYLRRWSNPILAQMLASVPTVMMWDDHDIIDGWGSYPQERLESPVFRALRRSAGKWFSIFQQHAVGEALPSRFLQPASGFTFAHRIGELAILALDLRAERTERQIIGEATWKRISAWMEDLAANAARRPKHLLVLSSVPVVHPRLGVVERVFDLWPGRQDLEDDLKDHWTSPGHDAERRRLIFRLLELQEQEIRVTILSGDVHVAALGVVESNRGNRDNAINQLTSSGIVHPPPMAAVVWAMQQLLAREEVIDHGITTRMLEIPSSGRKLVPERNFLSIQPDAADEGRVRGRLWAEWHFEHSQGRFQKAIHPVR